MDDLRSLGVQSYRIIGFALLTGLIHLYLGVLDGIPLFILNGLGFIALVAGLYFLPQLANWRLQLRWALVAYTAVTIIAYFVVNGQPFDSWIGLVTKAVEVILIVLLYLQQR